jgi:acyl carrier protein
MNAQLEPNSIADLGIYPTRKTEACKLNSKESEVISVVIELLMDLTQDWELERDESIGHGTALMKDMEFTSVDIIQFFVAIEEHYGGGKMGFQDLLMVDGLYVEDLTVEQITKFVSARIGEGISSD